MKDIPGQETRAIGIRKAVRLPMRGGSRGT